MTKKYLIVEFMNINLYSICKSSFFFFFLFEIFPFSDISCHIITRDFTQTPIGTMFVTTLVTTIFFKL